jgi:hypothetical protein
VHTLHEKQNHGASVRGAALDRVRGANLEPDACRPDVQPLTAAPAREGKPTCSGMQSKGRRKRRRHRRRKGGGSRGS